MKRMWIGVVALLGLIGCGGGKVEHLWVANYEESVGPGIAACVEGPYVSPSGASVFYDISDTFGDDMDVSIVPAGYACDGSSGLALYSSSNWDFRVSPSTGSVPAGSYSLAITCYNVVDYCTPFLYAFGYED
ncbi:MAG TPA: hypothetical protein VMT03_14850 [Polyangia bacterium]|nr:hypothetical protein [Polyangia bacterium]